MDIEVIIEGHEQRIKTLERDMSAMREVQAEIRSMNETLVTLANIIIIIFTKFLFYIRSR